MWIVNLRISIFVCVELGSMWLVEDLALFTDPDCGTPVAYQACLALRWAAAAACAVDPV